MDFEKMQKYTVEVAGRLIEVWAYSEEDAIETAIERYVEANS